MEVLLLGLTKIFILVIILTWIFEIVIWAFIAFALIAIVIGYIFAFIRRRKI